MFKLFLADVVINGLRYYDGSLYIGNADLLKKLSPRELLSMHS